MLLMGMASDDLHF